MLTLLQDILCAIETLAAGIISLLVVMLNAAIVAIGVFLGFLLSLLPNMPEPPSKPESGIFEFINFFVPLAPLAAMLVTMGTLFLGFMAVRVALNWMRAL